MTKKYISLNFLYSEQKTSKYDAIEFIKLKLIL